MGPALTAIGARRSAAHLKRKITNPAGDIPDDFRSVQITTRDGRNIRGIRLNEDSWSIQLRDFTDKFHSIWKDEIAKMTSEKRTPMPAIGTRLNEQELNDVVAFLATERGAQ